MIFSETTCPEATKWKETKRKDISQGERIKESQEFKLEQQNQVLIQKKGRSINDPLHIYFLRLHPVSNTMLCSEDET
jgi:hypothetical protein